MVCACAHLPPPPTCSVEQHLLHRECGDECVKLLHITGVAAVKCDGGLHAPKTNVALNLASCFAAREDVQAGGLARAWGRECGECVEDMDDCVDDCAYNTHAHTPPLALNNSVPLGPIRAASSPGLKKPLTLSSSANFSFLFAMLTTVYVRFCGAMVECNGGVQGLRWWGTWDILQQTFTTHLKCDGQTHASLSTRHACFKLLLQGGIGFHRIKNNGVRA